MLSKSQVGFIKSLHQKKYRKAHGIFIIEGIKSISEFIRSSYQVHSIYYLPQFQSSLQKLPANIKLFEVNNADLDKISTLQAPQGILALVHIPGHGEQETVPDLDPSSLNGKFTLVLDGVQDPGNLGTIIRTADWFGFDQIICSADTVEAYNPKVVQATMGSLSRIRVHYCDLARLISSATLPVFGALLNGNNIYETDWGHEGLIVLGSEGQGISQEIISLVGYPVTIPGAGAAESLNVAVSGAIFCSELYRNLHTGVRKLQK